MSHLNFWILALSTNFCSIKTDLSGNNVWPQASGFQKLAKLGHFWFFKLIFVHSKYKRSSLRSQCWMRLFLWFSNTVLQCQVETAGSEFIALISTHVLFVLSLIYVQKYKEKYKRTFFRSRWFPFDCETPRGLQQGLPERCEILCVLWLGCLRWGLVLLKVFYQVPAKT